MPGSEIGDKKMGLGTSSALTATGFIVDHPINAMSDAPKIILTLPTGEVRKYSLQMDSVRIGRAPDNTVVLEDPGLSLHHAVLHRRIDTFEIIDLGSTNGLEIAGKRVISHELKHGDEIKIGDVMMRYQVPGMEPLEPAKPYNPEETAPEPPSETPKEEKKDAPAKDDEEEAAKPAEAEAPKEPRGCMGAIMLFVCTLLAPIIGLHAHHFQYLITTRTAAMAS